jgi:hypothetical protein
VRARVPGDGNCLLHAWAVTHKSNLDVNALRELICDTMDASTPQSAWRRDTHFDLLLPSNSEFESETWATTLQMARPRQTPAPYLREVHARALAIATGNTIIVLNEKDRLRQGAAAQGTLHSPDLITVFLPDPDSEYTGVHEPVSTQSRRVGSFFKKYPGNKYSWDQFMVYWNTLTAHEQRECSILTFDGEILHYCGTRLQVQP